MKRLKPSWLLSGSRFKVKRAACVTDKCHNTTSSGWFLKRFKKSQACPLPSSNQISLHQNLEPMIGNAIISNPNVEHLGTRDTRAGVVFTEEQISSSAPGEVADEGQGAIEEGVKISIEAEYRTSFQSLYTVPNHDPKRSRPKQTQELLGDSNSKIPEAFDGQGRVSEPTGRDNLDKLGPEVLTVRRPASYENEATAIKEDYAEKIKCIQQEFEIATCVVKKACEQVSFLQQELQRTVHKKESARKTSNEKADEVSKLEDSVDSLQQELKTVQSENTTLSNETYDMRGELKRLHRFISSLQSDNFDDSDLGGSDYEIGADNCDGCRGLEEKLQCTRSANRTMAQAMVRYKKEAEEYHFRMLDMQTELDEDPKKNIEVINQRQLVEYKTRQIRDLQAQVNELSVSVENLQQQADRKTASMTTEMDRLRQNINLVVSSKEQVDARFVLLQRANRDMSIAFKHGTRPDNLIKGLSIYHKAVQYDNIQLSATVKILQEKLSEVTEMVVYSQIHSRDLSDTITSQSMKIASMDAENRDFSNENVRLQIELEAIQREHTDAVAEKDTKVTELENRLNEMIWMIPEEVGDGAKWHMGQKNKEIDMLRAKLGNTEDQLFDIRAAEDDRNWLDGLIAMTECQHNLIEEQQRTQLEEAITRAETLEMELEKCNSKGDLDWYKNEMELAQLRFKT